VASSDSSLGNPDHQVFMAVGDTLGPSGTADDRYLEDISADELSAKAPADETDANRDARRERNRKRNERHQDATGRISKWAIELGALNIDFKPRTAIKSQALVDFMAEWRENQLPTTTERPEHWVMYFDDSLNLEGVGAGVILISPTGAKLKYVRQIF
jgi:hypothetical protein